MNVDDIRVLGVVGAGQMGRGIAQVAAGAGLEVIMVDVSTELAAAGKAAIAAALARLVDKEKMTAEARIALLGRITTSGALEDLANADFIVEAATEDPSLKLELFRRIDAIAKPGVVIASNTSSISITMLGAVTKRPDLVIGMHFMNPVPVMKLVEIIRGLATNDETYALTATLATKLGKETVLCPHDTPGFIVNRVLLPLIAAAFRLLEQGVAAVDIDKGVTLGLNHPMGPLVLADFVGLDTCLAIMEYMYAQTGDPALAPPQRLRLYVAAGWYGRKTKRGVYEYK